jgi:hypothetical protein
MTTRQYQRNPNSIRQKIEDLLLEHGGMTLKDIFEELPGYTKGGVSKIICDLRDAGTIYIKDWVMEQPGEKRHPRPVWDHAKNSKRQPPHSKMRPLPPCNAVRLKQRRIRKGFDTTVTRYIFKMVKNPKDTHDEVINE